MFDRRQNWDNPILNEYIQLLEHEWTRQVACQNECGSNESCNCLRHIVHVDAQKAWWTRQVSESGNQTQLQRLLYEMPPAQHRTFPLEYQKLFHGEHSCLRVFSLLLGQEKGHLIDLFYDSDMIDKYLAIVRSGGDQRLYENLLKSTPRKEEADQIVEDFRQEQWAYCPLELTLHMDRNLQGTKVIPPFCQKIKLGNKGGTASIYWVAIQRDLISDEPLKLALQDSMYDDPYYGKCYQMALKSYCGNKKLAYEFEKEAFSALKPTDEVPIVQYLGCYTHDYGEGSNMGKTYNLLLEYGEKDLYESWADETNVPPVRAEEIIRYWDSLFEVANAIRHVHHLELPHGKAAPLRFHGWHADIKPDNILLVHGKLKLADFGFSRFAPVAERENGSIPTEFIHGFTDTYGAPEVSRMKRIDGTLSGVTQDIDAWSFGCVLSVAATWVVLGFQGVRQYEQLRRLSPGNSKNGIKHDRFHDGSEVLPEVLKWHNYLRGHLRPSDALTENVLDVIERKMLQTQPSDRYNLEDLCKELEELTEVATKIKIHKLGRFSKETDSMVLKALLMFEEAAENQTFSSQEPNSDPFQQQSIQDNVDRVNPRQKTSRQIQKENAIKSKPLGQTAFRRDIIRSELKSRGLGWEENERNDGEKHEGAMTNSPTGTQSSLDVFPVERRVKLRNPQAQGASGLLSAATAHAPPFRKVGFGATPTQFTDRGPSGYTQPSREFVQRPSNVQANPYPTPRETPESVRSNRQRGKEPETPTRHQSNNPSWQGSPQRSYPQTAKAFESPLESPSSVAYAVGPPSELNSPLTFTPIEGLAIAPVQPTQRYSNTAPQLSHPTPRRFNTNDEYINDRDDGTSNQTETSPKSGPSITLSQPVHYSPSASAFQDGLHPVTVENTVHNPHGYGPRSDHVDVYRPVPSSVYELPFSICRKREMLDQQVLNRIGKWKGKLGLETRNKDTSLAQAFSKQRELIFVIDNGWTMFKHWPIVIFVAETLATTAAGLDKSGIDLRFTIEGYTHNKNDLKGDSGRNVLNAALNHAWPEKTEDENSKTDMGAMFDSLYQEWKRKGASATTLLVLTDGVWSKTKQKEMNKTIHKIAKLDNKHTGHRHFSIQFVRFGDEIEEVQKLQWLDDKLCEEEKLRDIIDHCSWRTDVDKIFKGSIMGDQDQNCDEPPNPYNYAELVKVFRQFNEKGNAGLQPPSPDLNRTPSRSSSRNSNRHSKSSSMGFIHMPRRESLQPHLHTSPQSA